MNREDNDGWNEWSKHVLAELKRLNDNYESLRSVNEEIKQEIKQETIKLSSMEDSISSLKSWKAKFDDSITPSQITQLSKKVEELERFKITAVTIWAVIQSVTIFAAGFLKELL